MCFVQSPNICIKKKVLVVYVVFFVCFEVFFSFLKSFVYFFSLKTAYLASLVYILYIEKKIYHSFLFVNTDCFSSHFPCQLCPLKHWIFKFCHFFSFVLISCKKSQKSRSYICNPPELAQSRFRTKKTVWKVAGVLVIVWM